MATLFKRSNGIYYQITSFGGRQVWRSTGARSLVKAEKAIASNLPKHPINADLTLSQFAQHFKPYAETNYALGTRLLYEQTIRTFIRIIGNYNLRAYTIQDVESFKAKRIKEVSPVKVNIDFRTLRALFQTAVRWKLIDENPFHGVKQIKVPQQRPVYLSKEAFRALLQVVTIPWFKELIVFAVCTMMRAGEIASLKWNSVDLKRRLIMVENTKEFRVKCSKPRVVPMNDWVFGYLATRERKEGYVFTFPDGKNLSVGYMSLRFKKYVRKAGLPDDIHFHSLRHTGASWLVQEGVSIYAVQKLLGHSNISVTQVYSHLEAEGLHSVIGRISDNFEDVNFCGKLTEVRSTEMTVYKY